MFKIDLERAWIVLKTIVPLVLLAGLAFSGFLDPKPLYAASSQTMTQQIFQTSHLKNATSSHIVSTQEKASALKYWTSTRMKSARSADVLVSQVGPTTVTPVSVGTPGSIAGVPPQHRHYTQSTMETTASHTKSVLNRYKYPFPYKRYAVPPDRYKLWPYVTVGKVFYKLDGQDWVCSGTAVFSKNNSVVDTAGHCVVRGGSGNDWATDWYFCPAFKDGACPLGKWVARQLFSDTNWINKGSWEYDYGDVVVDLNGTTPLDAVVGSMGVAWNQSRDQSFKAWGYPLAPPFDGSRMFECDAPYATDLSFKTGLPMMGIGCDMTAGASGGPWVIYSKKLKGDYVNGHNDYKLDSQPEAMYSPYYGNDWYNLVYNPAQNA